MQIEGARRKEHGEFYVGKRCVYVYKAQTKKCVPQHPERKTRVRAVWGKVTRIHGNTGSVRARFNRNLPGHAMGHRIRIVSSTRKAYFLNNINYIYFNVITDAVPIKDLS